MLGLRECVCLGFGGVEVDAEMKRSGGHGWEGFWPVGCFRLDRFFYIHMFFLAVKEMGGCDFGWEKIWMDVVKFGDITRIDDMA